MILRESHSKIEMTNLEIDGSTEKKKTFCVSLVFTDHGKRERERKERDEKKENVGAIRVSLCFSKSFDVKCLCCKWRSG